MLSPGTCGNLSKRNTKAQEERVYPAPHPLNMHAWTGSVSCSHCDKPGSNYTQLVALRYFTFKNHEILLMKDIQVNDERKGNEGQYK